MPYEAYAKLQGELNEAMSHLDRRSQRRTLAEIRGVNMCSNDYLGLASHPMLRAAVQEAVAAAPRLGGTGSRLLSGHARVWDELEDEFANFAGTEAALYFGSGYAANLGVLASLLGKEDVVFSDALNHASLIDGIRLSGARCVVYRHLDCNDLECSMRAEHSRPARRRLVVSESVFSMNGDVVDAAVLVALGARYDAAVILDEAHATAVRGPSGSGVAAAAGLQNELAAIVHTCGKALASAGAFVCGSRVLRDYLINHARTFIFSTAPPPHMAAQVRAALRLAQGMDAERSELRSRAVEFARALRSDGWDTAASTSQIVPAIIGSNDDALRAAEHLRQNGFAVRAIRPPTVPEGTARLRFSLTCGIQVLELTRVREHMARWRANHAAKVTAGCE
jgi:8-amino-7-oxononanoate synthase